MGAAHRRTRSPFVLGGGVHWILHETVGAWYHARPAIVGRTVETNSGAEYTAWNFQSADEAGQQRTSPAALVAAPAIVHSFAKRDCNRPVGQRHPFNLDRLADMGMGEELVGNAADGGCRNVADRCRPFWRIVLRKSDEVGKGRAYLAGAADRGFVIGADLNAVNVEFSLQRRFNVGGVEDDCAGAALVEDERLSAVDVAQEEAIGTDQIRRRGAVLEKHEIEPRARMLVQQYVDHRKEKGRVGLWLDRNPFSRAGTGDREVRFDLHTLHAALACIGMALDATNAARRLDIGAQGNEILAQRRVRRDREGAMPQLAVKMFRVVAFHALARAEAHVHRAPCGKEGRQRPHIGGRRAAAAEARGE